MGSTEYIIILCFVITIWSNTVNADIDCRRFVFAPSCRGVSAKRSQVRRHNSQGKLNENYMDEESEVMPSQDSDSELQTQRRYQKRFSDLLKSSLLRRVRSKDLNRYNSLMRSLEDLFASNELND